MSLPGLPGRVHFEPSFPKESFWEEARKKLQLHDLPDDIRESEQCWPGTSTKGVMKKPPCMDNAAKSMALPVHERALWFVKRPLLAALSPGLVIQVNIVIIDSS